MHDATSVKVGRQGQQKAPGARKSAGGEPARASRGVGRSGSSVGPAAASNEAGKPPFLIHDLNSGTNPPESSKIDRYSERIRRGRLIARAFETHGSEAGKALAAKMRGCGSQLWFRHYFSHPEQPTKLAAGIFCQQARACPFCAARRAAVSVRKAVPKTLAALSKTGGVPYLLTLTCKNRSTLAESCDELLGAFARMLQKRRDSGKGRHGYSAFSQILGGLLSCEAKRGSGSGLWHFHAHAVVIMPRDLRRDFFFRRNNQAAGSLADEWSELLGYAANCDLRPLKAAKLLEHGWAPEEVREAIGQELCEVFKYALKLSELPVNDHLEAIATLKGRRLVRAFGVLHGIKESEAFEDDLQAMEGWPYVELFYKFLQGQLMLQEGPKPNSELLAWNCN